MSLFGAENQRVGTATSLATSLLSLWERLGEGVKLSET